MARLKEMHAMQRIGWVIVLAAAVAFGVFASAGWGQSRPTDKAAGPDPEQLMNHVLEAILAGEYDQAFERLRQVAAEPLRDTKEAFDGLSLQTQKAFELYGRPADFQLARWQSAGPHLLRLHYVVRCPRHPVCWRVTFYRPAGEWTLINVAFSEDLDPVFGQ